MAILRPFQAIRPQASLAGRVAALPYDVINSQEAREAVKGNPYSFLHVDKAEIDLDASIDIYDQQVYKKAAENLSQMAEKGVCLQEETPCFYIYQQEMDGRTQNGIVGCASIDDYLQNHIKKHELTRADKEADRIRHVDICDANTGPIFLTYRAVPEISARVELWIRNHEPVYDFIAEDGIGHRVWVVDSQQEIAFFAEAFCQVPDFYIADGHHRAASAVKVGQKRRQEHPDYTGEEEFNYFLSVLFPDEQLRILDYNRVVHDLNGMEKEEFLEKLGMSYECQKVQGPCRPQEKHTMGMYLDGQWYHCRARAGSFSPDDPVGRLDVSILQNQILTPLLGIEDPRTSSRIEFVGGIRGLKELEKMVDGGMAVAFAMYPTGLDDLMEIADGGHIMPPKSTWFEPKLRSGLFIHRLSS